MEHGIRSIGFNFLTYSAYSIVYQLYSTDLDRGFMRTKQVNIRLEPSLIEQYEAMAKRDDRDRTYFMKKALIAYLEPKKQVPAKSSKFQPPELIEVQDLFLQKGSTADEALKFMNFYESKGWMVGKNKMKSWTAAAANWMKGGSGYKTAQEKRASRNSEIFDYDNATMF